MESLRSGLKGTRSNKQEAVNEQELNPAPVGQYRRPILTKLWHSDQPRPAH